MAGKSSPEAQNKFIKKAKWLQKVLVRQNKQGQDDNTSEQVCRSFHQYLQQNQFAKAEQHLIRCEDNQFLLRLDGVGSNSSLIPNNEEESLNKNFEDLMQKVWLTVQNTFSVQTEEEKEVLKQAVLAIQQEEEQDRRWDGVNDTERPPWRPRCCRHTHDTLLEKMVNQRMEEAKLESNSELKSSIKREITAKGKQLKEDLLTVAKHVRSCYPGENVCQLYATLYHQAFSATLREIADYGLCQDDCQYILMWINQEYPGILSHEELSEVIKYEQLEALLPDDMLASMEEDFLNYRENDLQTWIHNALNSAMKDTPELSNECYYSPLALDVIGCISEVLKSVEMVLGSKAKTQRITNCIKEYLFSYQLFIEKHIGNNQMNTEAVLKAHIPCITQLRDYIKNEDCFTEPNKTDCISLLTQLIDNCHGYFLKPIHKDLKKTYDNIGSPKWLTHNEHVCNDLIGGLKRHIQNLSKLENTCLKELVGHLHKDVLVKYVSKMMKRKNKLRDEKELHDAATALSKDSQKIHSLFTEEGSNMDWLEKILPDLAELLTLNDPQCIEQYIVLTLLGKYPDLSEEHVSAWLNLKANLSNSDIKQIKKVFSEFKESERSECTADNKLKDPGHLPKNFFSKVVIKKF